MRAESTVEAVLQPVIRLFYLNLVQSVQTAALPCFQALRWGSVNSSLCFCLLT